VLYGVVLIVSMCQGAAAGSHTVLEYYFMWICFSFLSPSCEQLHVV